MLDDQSKATNAGSRGSIGPMDANPSGNLELEHARLDFEREKWQAEQALAEAELQLKRDDLTRSRWINPLVIAVFAAAAAALGNAGVTWISSREQFALERSKSEATRILEVVRNADPDKAAINLKFLIDAGLIADQPTRDQIQEYLKMREPGKGFSLPSPTGVGGGQPQHEHRVRTIAGPGTGA
jgi:hypothetical protein